MKQLSTLYRNSWHASLAHISDSRPC